MDQKTENPESCYRDGVFQIYNTAGELFSDEEASNDNETPNDNDETSGEKVGANDNETPNDNDETSGGGK